ncbi:MAG: hypothetical protein J6S71_04985 [Clostridia bacterium]|nr:hypothetical protein [Clostridia bacterium]
MSERVFKDTRLLEALEFIDDEYIASAARYKMKYEAQPTKEPKMTWRTSFKHWKQLVALAACILLLSIASPLVSYIAEVIRDFNAGAGSENIENTDYFNYSNDMSVDEVLADVIQKGYVVISDGKCISGREKWNDFLKAVENGEPITVRIAYHESYEMVASSPRGPHTNLDDFPSINLRMVEYNGKTFKFVSKKHKLDGVFEKEYPYIVSYDLGDKTSYYVSMLTEEELSVTDPSNPFAKACGHGSSISSNLADQCDCLKVIIFLDTTSDVQYEYTPSIGSLEQISEVGVTIGNVTVEAQKHISAVYNCIGKDEASGEFIYSTLGEGIINFEKGIPKGCPILRAEGSAEITVLTDNLGFTMSLYDMSGRNDVMGVEEKTITLPTVPGLYYLNIFVDIDHPQINDEIVPVVGSEYVAEYRYLVAIVVE